MKFWDKSWRPPWDRILMGVQIVIAELGSPPSLFYDLEGFYSIVKYLVHRHFISSLNFPLLPKSRVPICIFLGKLSIPCQVF